MSGRGCRQQSWVASSQGTFKPMRGAGSRFSSVRFEVGQVRVIEPKDPLPSKQFEVDQGAA